MINNSSSASTKTHGFKFRAVTSIVTAAFIFSATVSAYAASDTQKFNVVDGEKSISISAKATNPQEIVRLAGIKLGAYDELDLSNYSGKDGDTILVERAKVLRVDDEGKVGYYVGYSNTVNEVFEDRGIILNDGDIVSSELTSKVFDGMRLIIKRAFSVTVEADGKEITVPIVDETVAQTLEKAGISLGENDIVSLDLDSRPSAMTKIRVYRVEYKTSSKQAPVDYSTEITYDGNMYVGESVIDKQGVKGEKNVYYTDKYVDGVLSESNFKSEEITKAPNNEVKRIGTKSKDVLSAYRNTAAPISELDVPENIKLDENGAPVNYKSKVDAKATAYTGDPETASGRKPMAGHIAVDPKEYPYGTELYITSADGTYVYGYCVAADTGGFVKMGNTDVDLYMNNEQMCDDWGNRPITIYVL